MTGPEQILRILDDFLSRPVRLVLYGRAALALGFRDVPGECAATMDVDAILPEIELPLIEADEQFWRAIENTNQKLDSSGLYLTHLFVDSQIILTPDWLERIVPISMPGLQKLTLYRPSTADLVLTKMMRVDPQDRADICFLLGHLALNRASAARLFSAARVPDLWEIKDAFHENKEWLIHHLTS